MELLEDVRAFFKVGHKSNNKLYHLSDINARGGSAFGSLVDKCTARYEQAKKSSTYHRRIHQGPAMISIELAYHLLHMGSDNVSGNCFEMAVMSAYFAMSKYNASADELRLGSVLPPGDHAFCLIGATKEVRDEEDLDSVNELTGTRLAEVAYIVDPWLNTACKAKYYLMHARQRFQKWHKDCKRISWSGEDGRSPGWYSPLGDYDKVFMYKARVKLARFSGFK
jgi:hypothetical protein